MKKANSILSIIFSIILGLTVVLVFYAIAGKNVSSEAYIGSFEAEKLDTGWEIVRDNGESFSDVTLPYRMYAKMGEHVTLSGQLPADISDGMRLCLRSTRQEITVYINGEERGHYRPGHSGLENETVVSGFFLVDLNDADANAKITADILFTESENGVVNGISYGYGNNVWFEYFVKNLPLTIMATILVLVGFIAMMFFVLAKDKGSLKAVFFLAEAMIVVGLWILSESEIRQVIFYAPSYTNIISFVLIETVAAFFSLYFNEIQGGHYERVYLILECGIIVQFLVNSILNFSGAIDYYRSLPLSHLWAVAVIIIVIVTMVFDFRSGRIKNYKYTAVGVSVVVFAAVIEICSFYMSDTCGFGLWLGIGLLALLVATIAQTIRDTIMAAAANEAKSRFLASMSHEIRTPINTVLGMDEMILRDSTDPRINEYAKDIHAAGSALLAIINDILDISKIESGKMEIMPVEYSLKKLLTDVRNMIQERAAKKDLNLIVDAQEDLPSILKGDDIRIRQIITNLMTNAVKYTDIGSVTLKVRGHREGNDEVLLFEVIDTGIGIQPEDMPKLFEEFERMDEFRNRSVEGTGLGLNISQYLLKLMGSSLKAESTYGEGSRFYFEIRQVIVSDEPIGDIDATVIENVAAPESVGCGFIAKDARILVVDDNEMNLKVVESMLVPTEIHVVLVDSGQRAITQASYRHFDLILMDHMMPEMDGLEAMQRIRKLAEGDSFPCKDTPIYVLTANAMSGMEEKFLKEGFDGFISKPVSSDELLKAVLEVLPEEKIVRVGE